LLNLAGLAHLELSTCRSVGMEKEFFAATAWTPAGLDATFR
jgi:hypothetical protein